MEFDIVHIGDVVVFRLKGDFTSSSGIRQLFLNLIEKDYKKFLFDMGSLRIINSIGLTTLLEFQRIAESNGGGIRICSMNKSLRQIFRSAKTEDAFRIHDDEETALVELIGIISVKTPYLSTSRYLN